LLDIIVFFEQNTAYENLKNICDEEFGSWGSQGLEVAIKTWLSGGKVMVSHKNLVCPYVQNSRRRFRVSLSPEG